MIEAMAIADVLTADSDRGSNAARVAVDELKRRARTSVDPRLSAACIYILDKLLLEDESGFLIEELHRVTCAIKANNAYLWQLIQVLHRRGLLLNSSGDYEPLRSGVGDIGDHVAKADAVLDREGASAPW